MDGSSTDPAADTMTGASTSREQFSILPKFEHLNDVRTVVRANFGETDLNADALYLVAVTEVVTNAIEEHHRTDNPEGIDITVDFERRVVEVADRGSGYDPADRAARRSVMDGGWGLDIAEAGSTGLSWRHNADGGTTFTLPAPAL